VPIAMQRAWLTEEMYERARIELAELLIRRTPRHSSNLVTSNNVRGGSAGFKNSSATPSSATSLRMTASASPAWC
jgi:hypothetical protein